ncbi:MAG: hypothetical protein ACE14W_08185 [Candidatus Velamenicoccus archaeovorus]
MRRFLATPTGWFGLLVVELALLVLGMRLVSRLFPGLSVGAGWTILVAAAAALAVVNYAIRRRYLSEP